MTDITKLKFLSGTLREDKQGTYDYITLLKQGLTVLGVTYPSGGGGGSYTFSNGLTELSDVVTLGDTSLNSNVTFHHATNVRFIHSTTAALGIDSKMLLKQLNSSEFGINAAVGGWVEALSETQTGQEGNPTARKNVVYSFGYNYDGGEIIAGEGYMRIGMESNYRPGGGEEWFEYHAPEVRYRNGQVSRWWSVIANKNNNTDARHMWDGSSFSFRKVQDTAVIYAAFTGSQSEIKGNQFTLYNTAGTTNYYIRMLSDGTDSYIYNQTGSLFVQSNASLHIQAANSVEINRATNVNSTVTLRNALAVYSGVSATDEFKFTHTGATYGSSYAGIGLNEGNVTTRNAAYRGAAFLFDTRDIAPPLRIQTQAAGGLSMTALSFDVDAYTYLNRVPQQDDTLTQVIVRDDTTGQLKYRAAATFGIGSLTDYADDVAAAAGGVLVGGYYRTGSVLKVRVS